jgi:DNA-binding transcriptional LysR family regulator
LDLLRAFEIFVQTVEAGSLSAAARQLQLTPSAVSKQITALEEHMGTALLARNTRGLSLTEAGLYCLERSRGILTEITALRAALHDGADPRSVRGTLRISAPPGLGRLRVAPIIRRFTRLHPRMKVELNLTSRDVDLVSNRIDLAIRLGPLDDSELIATKLFRVRSVVVASPAYLQRRGAPMEPSDLRDHDCLLMTNVTVNSQWYFRRDAGSAAAAVSVAGVLSADDAGVLYQAVLDGQGIGLLPNWLVDGDLRNRRLIAVLSAWEADLSIEPRSVYAVYPAMEYTPAKTRAFLNLLKVQLAKDLKEEDRDEDQLRPAIDPKSILRPAP